MSLSYANSQDEAIPHPTSAPTSATTVRPAQQNNPPAKNKPQGNVRISAWRLAKLNKAEATRAAASARKASSILRPVPPPNLDVLNESEESYTSNSSRHSIVSTEFGTPEFPLQKVKNENDSRSSMSLSPFKLELPRIRTGREPEVIGAWTKSLGMDLKSSSSSSSKSSFFGRQLVDAASRFSGSSISSSQQPGDSANPSGKVNINPKVARAMGSTLSDGYEASAGETTDDMRRSGKGRLMFIRESKHSPAGSSSGPSFGTRAASQLRGVSTASRTIQFRGRGISTSVLSAYQSRPSRRPPSSSFSSDSDPDTGSLGNVITSSQGFPGRRSVGNLQVHEPSIFFSSPLMPIGEATTRRPPPAPPSNNQPPVGMSRAPLRSGTIPGAPTSVRTYNSRVTMLPPSHGLDPSDR